MRGRPLPRFHWLPLAHHPESQALRCVHLPLQGRSIAVCARCLGLYPMLAAALLLQGALGWGALGALDHWAVLGLSLPGLLDWGAGVLDPASGSNLRRLATGGLLGLALGRSLWLHFRDPPGEVFGVQALLLATGVLAFLFLRALRGGQDEGL